MTAVAICANPLPGLVWADGIQGPNPDPRKSVHARCSGTQKVIGTGAAITGGRGRATLEVMLPFHTNESFATAFEMPGTTPTGR